MTITFSSCRNNFLKITDSKDFKSSTVIPDSRPIDSISLDTLLIISKSKAIEIFGAPATQECFVPEDVHAELRSPIYDRYFQDTKLNDIILIEQLTWEKDSAIWFTVWYRTVNGEREPIYTTEWDKI